MFGSRWHLFRVFGIPIGIDPSWVIILAILTWSLATGFFAPALPEYQEISWWLLGLGTALAFFICLVLHEMGHALVARSRGIPIRGIRLFLFGGVSEMGSEPGSASSEFLMAIAGPLVSAALAVIFWLLWEIGLNEGWPVALLVFCWLLARINLTVLIFNLVPAFPLDGGRVLRSILWGALRNLRRATYIAALLGQGFAWFLIVVGVLCLFHPETLLTGIWLGLIGMFLNSAAQASYQQVLIRQALKGEPVRRFMNPQPIVVPPTLDLRSWVEDYVYRYHRKMFPVATDGHLLGIIRTKRLAEIPREERSHHQVSEVMEQDLRPIIVSPDTDALDALSQMQQTGSSRLLVMEGDRLVGIVSLKDLLSFLNLKMELDAGQDNAPRPPRQPWYGSERKETPAPR
jgi:Zn-dependent protease/CBS domain-containing protein